MTGGGGEDGRELSAEASIHGTVQEEVSLTLIRAAATNFACEIRSGGHVAGMSRGSQGSVARTKALRHPPEAPRDKTRTQPKTLVRRGKETRIGNEGTMTVRARIKNRGCPGPRIIYRFNQPILNFFGRNSSKRLLSGEEMGKDTECAEKAQNRPDPGCRRACKTPLRLPFKLLKKSDTEKTASVRCNEFIPEANSARDPVTIKWQPVRSMSQDADVGIVVCT